MKLTVATACAASALIVGAMSGAVAAEEPIRIGLFGFSADNAFSIAAYEGLKQAAAEKGNVEIEFFDGGFDAQKQYNQVQDAVATGRFDGILVMAMGFASIVPAVEEAIASGIKVGSLEYALGPDATITDRFQVDGMTTFVGYNVASIGTRLAEATVEACADRDPCKVGLLVGSRSAAQDVPKIAAYEAVMKDHPQIETVATLDTWWAREQGLKATQDILQSTPDIDVITSFADQAIAGAEVALLGAGVEVGGADGVRLIGLGATTTALAGIREDRWYGTYVELPWEEGYLGGLNIISAIRGEPFEAIIDLETRSPAGAAVATKPLLDKVPDWSAKWDG